MASTLKSIALSALFLALAACATPYQNPDTGFIGGSGSGGAPNYVTSYDMVFENFNGHDFMSMEGRLRGFPGYRSHRISESTGMVTRVWYETALGTADMKRFLVQAADGMGYDVRISMSGNSFLVQKY